MDFDKIDFNVVDHLSSLFESRQGGLLNQYQDVDRLEKKIKCQTNDLYEFLNLIPHKKILEIGTYRAFFSYFVKTYFPDVEQIHTYDIQEESQLCVDYVNELFKENFIKFHNHSSNNIMGGAVLWLNGYFDFCWLDGAHSYEMALNDLLTCDHLEIPYVGVDDYNSKGVAKAVDDFLKFQKTYRIKDISKCKVKICFLERI